MARFEDEFTKNIYDAVLKCGVPPHVRDRAREVMAVVAAAGSLQDIGVLGKITRRREMPCRLGVTVDENWRVTFVWDDLFGASSIHLERR